jgi:hypothetical protein
VTVRAAIPHSLREIVTTSEAESSTIGLVCTSTEQKRRQSYCVLLFRDTIAASATTGLLVGGAMPPLMEPPTLPAVKMDGLLSWRRTKSEEESNHA